MLYKIVLVHILIFWTLARIGLELLRNFIRQCLDVI